MVERVDEALRQLEQATEAGDAYQASRALEALESRMGEATSRYQLDGDDLSAAIARREEAIDRAGVEFRYSIKNIQNPPSILDDWDPYDI